jgi:hypothetical protein
MHHGSVHLCEEVILGFPLPLWERDRVRGKVAATSLFNQTKNRVRRSLIPSAAPLAPRTKYSLFGHLE